VREWPPTRRVSTFWKCRLGYRVHRWTGEEIDTSIQRIDVSTKYWPVRKRFRVADFNLLENSGLYWHIVDIVWIFLFPLFYLIT
jgi:heme/copper-type cytochrome/quinol oxidase subunit 3